MRYKNIIEARLIDRPNRFIANVDINGVKEVVHVKNTGRCKELIISGAKVYLAVAENPERKTKYDLIAVEKKLVLNTKFKNGIKPIKAETILLVNMDSQVPNSLVEEWLRKGNLFSKNAIIRREFTYHNSRFDFYIEDCGRKVLMEVKGGTLENNGIASFPDAPTERGVKHIKELQKSLSEGYEAFLFFVIQMEAVKYFCPNDINHKAFGDALREGARAGVKIIAMDCKVTPASIEINAPVEVCL